MPKDDSTLEPLVVACLINQNTRTWNVIKLEELFYMNSVEAILKINIPLTPRPDKNFWTPNPKGKFFVKFAFACSQTSLDVEVSSPHWKALWKLKIHDRLKMLIWRIGAGVLPTNGNFVAKLEFGDSNCSLAAQQPKQLYTCSSTVRLREPFGLFKIGILSQSIFLLLVALTLSN